MIALAVASWKWVALAFGVTVATVDPAWAIPVNTFILLVIAIVNVATHGRVKVTQRDVRNTADAAASAAEAAAAAARITKELGGAVREARSPLPRDGAAE